MSNDLELEEEEKLTPKQLLFIEAMCGEAHFNASKSAALAGYSGRPATVASIGNQMAHMPKIKQAIAARLAKRCMGSEEALEKLATQARGIGPWLRVAPSGNIECDFPGMLKAGAGHLIKGIKHNRYGQQVEFVDPQAALFKIGQHHRLWSDGGDIDIKVLNVIFESLPPDLREDVRLRVMATLGYEA